MINNQFLLAGEQQEETPLMQGICCSFHVTNCGLSNIIWSVRFTLRSILNTHKATALFALSLRISGQLPAPTVNGREDSYWKWPDLQLWRACDLDLGSGHTAYRRASLIDLYLRGKVHWNRTNVLWTDGRRYVKSYTYVRTGLTMTGIWDRLY